MITSDKAGLWTDSRYFLQAEQQLEGSGIDLYKEMLPETPSILDFLRENLTANSVVGIDGKVFSTTQAIALQEDLAKNDITVKSIADPMNEIWTDRPPIARSTRLYPRDEIRREKAVRDKLDCYPPGR